METKMKTIIIKHKFSLVSINSANIGLVAASTDAGEIHLAWRSNDLPNPVAGEATFRASSPVYASDNTAASGNLALPLSGRSTFLVVTFLNNAPRKDGETMIEANIRLDVGVGNADGTSPESLVETEKVKFGESLSFQVAFIPG